MSKASKIRVEVPAMGMLPASRPLQHSSALLMDLRNSSPSLVPGMAMSFEHIPTVDVHLPEPT